MTLEQRCAENQLEICIARSPSELAQKGFQALFNELVNDKVDWDKILQRLCWSLLDGVSYGNWPKESNT